MVKFYYKGGGYRQICEYRQNFLALSTKGVPNIAEIFGQKTFGDIAPPL